jgi:hypothetical protein
MKRRPLPDEEYNDEVRIGEQVGEVHDECFIGFRQPSAEFEAALLAGVAALHATYLGRESLPPEVLRAVRERLREGWSVEIEANRREASLRIRAFPADAGWWTRAAARSLTLFVNRV